MLQNSQLFMESLSLKLKSWSLQLFVITHKYGGHVVGEIYILNITIKWSPTQLKVEEQKWHVFFLSPHPLSISFPFLVFLPFLILLTDTARI